MQGYDDIPILPIVANVIYPSALYPLTIQGAEVIELLTKLEASQTPLGLFLQRDPDEEQPGPEDIYHIGTTALIYSSEREDEETLKLTIQGLARVRLVDITATEPYITGRVEMLPDMVRPGVGDETGKLEIEVRRDYNALLEQHPQLAETLREAADGVDDPVLLAYLVAATAPFANDERQRVLEANGGAAKLGLVLKSLRQLLGAQQVTDDIKTQVQQQISKSERDFLLREQLKAIQKELGQHEGDELAQLRARVEGSAMPEPARVEAERELARLAGMTPAAPDYIGTRTYIDWLLELPWDDYAGGTIDIPRARAMLERDHYGLAEAKQRILEYLSVRKLRNARSAGDTELLEPAAEPILCFVGPPGVGKTSLAQSIAEALDRPFVRLPVGGMRDEAEIRGHRRTYLGALPGRLIAALRRVGAKDPLVLLDELDKLGGADFRGDPEAALLEVLDPTQQGEFRDRYLDVPFDLSSVMFIATANVLDTLHPALRDRLEVIELSGYTEEEKLEIARRHLVPRQMRAHALTDDDAIWQDDALLALIRDHTREAGVRNLEREIAGLARRVASSVADGDTASDGPLLIDADAVGAQLGKPRYCFEVAEATERPGVATGLVWTPVGGDIVFIEASQMPGGKTLTVTGQLGEVMRESAQAALTWVRSSAEELGIDPRFYEQHDIHIHVPAGAVPKDGPSAGVTLTAALVSLLTGAPLRSDVAMTGEITLRGRVLPVGGVKEKVLAARRAGLHRVILPARNERDLDELAPEARDGLDFVLVDNMQEALQAALEDSPKGRTRRSARGNARQPVAPMAAKKA